MSDSSNVLNIIKEELQKSKSSSSKILNTLLDLRKKEEFQQLSDSEFYDIVGETINSKPEFFMKKIYKSFRNQVRKLIGDEKFMEMEKYILEKYFLHEGEQILLELKGNFGQNRRMTDPIFINNANLFVTSDRIIAQGKLRGPYNKYISDLAFYGYLIPIKNNFKLRRVRNNVRYRVIVSNKESEVNIKITLGESEAKREENINKLFEILSKETNEEPSS
ncbi:MAG: hypothetical protein ACFFEN_08105 [Candidatus Thorarchaeota archaeon]